MKANCLPKTQVEWSHLECSLMYLKAKTSGSLLALLNFPKSVPCYFSRLLPSFPPASNPAPRPQTCLIVLLWFPSDNRSNQKRNSTFLQQWVSQMPTYLEECLLSLSSDTPDFHLILLVNNCVSYIAPIFCLSVLSLGRIICISILIVLSFILTTTTTKKKNSSFKKKTKTYFTFLPSPFLCDNLQEKKLNIF